MFWGAPSLENTLHKKLEEQRVNKVNLRKEFFRVTIEDIGKVCEELGCEVQLTKVAEAREYNETREINRL